MGCCTAVRFGDNLIMTYGTGISRSKDGYTPLHEASRSGFVFTAQLLVESNGEASLFPCVSCPCRNSAIFLIFPPVPLRPGGNLLHSRPASPHSGGNRKQILESIVPTDSHIILDFPRSPDIVTIKYTEVARIWDSRFVS